MLPRFKKAREIADWMDSRDYPLVACYENQIEGYSRAAFLSDLRQLPAAILAKHLVDWREITISRCFKGLKRLPLINEVKEVLKALAERLNTLPIELDAQAIGNALYGLQSMDAKNEAVQAVLCALADKITASSASLNAQEIGNALYGLQNMDARSEAVQAVLRALADKITASSAMLSAQAIGNALYGLQNMGARSEAVQAVLRALADKITTSSARLDAQAIGNALYGLQNMDARSEAVQMVLQALAAKITTSSASLDAQAIGNALYGLQNMDARSEAVQAVLRALADKITVSSANLNGQAIGNALYGLQNMDARSEAVQAVLWTLANKITVSSASLNAQEIGNALYGLQNMDAQNEAVQAVLWALANKITTSSARLNAQDIGNALYGLQNMGNFRALPALIKHLTNKYPADFSYEKTPLEWQMAVASYLTIAYQTQNVNLRALISQHLKRLFPTCSTNQPNEIIKQIETMFINKLKLTHVKNSQIDLHHLDYLSASLLLNKGLKETTGVNAIIFGAGSHSKSAHQHKMRDIVVNYCQTNHIATKEWEKGRVKLDALTQPSNSSIWRSPGFVSNLNVKAPAFNPRTKASN
ncbi:Response regulator consisting of a CheY-like receiver domain and a Fis-type HTH domain [Legionella beliardensis]|uniref:Response regulator consisting of a CheY-like receiver domain and a Fis-type HTH domain n=1 Tax=Legionella beliardensis TaxID=91822 RepID=A0A378I3B0_9GAMM|nr:hypothetical protein [Legionella beliardensis]STX29205.1 Response regulator consisting of a CheY-like receiver domain and a Fis-type HTH domain [Legionella beliardensis]